MVGAVYVMVVIRGDRPRREVETVLRRGGGHIDSLVRWMTHCGRGQGVFRKGALMIRVLGVTGAKGGGDGTE